MTDKLGNPTDESGESSTDSEIREPFQGTEDDFNRLFATVMREFQPALEDYLRQRRVPPEQSEETVQDFFAKQYSKRTVFPRLQRWLERDQTPERCLAFLKASLLHHHFDLHRRSNRHVRLEPGQAEQSEPSGGAGQPQDSLNANWAANILKVAIQDLQAILLADQTPVLVAPVDSQEPPPSNGLLNWRIFVEKFCSPSMRRLLSEQKSTAQEIANRWGLKRDQVQYRIQFLREQFARHVRQTLMDSSMNGSVEQLLSELREALVLGGVHLPDLLRDLPTTDADSALDAAQIFSMVTVEQLPTDDALELLVPPEPSTHGHETRELWWLVLRRVLRVRPSGPPGSSATDNASRTIEELLFSAAPEISHLVTIKRMARQNGRCEHAVLQQIYHLLYALAIARAYNVCGQVITSLPPSKRIHSLGHAACYPWIPESAARELELAIRGFADSRL